MVKFEKDAKARFVCGRRGCGKTTGVKALIKKNTHVIVFDVLHEYEGKGWAFVENIESVSNQNDLLRYIKRNFTKGFKISVRASEEADNSKELLTLIKLLKDLQMPYKKEQHNQKLTFVIEEMSVSLPNIRNATVNSCVKYLINTGRHYGFDVIGVSQRPAQVHTDFVGQTAEDYFYALSDINDVKRIKNKIGKDWIEKLKTLPNHSYLHYTGDKITVGKNKLN